MVAPPERLPELATRLMELDTIEAAYVQPISAPPRATATSGPTVVLASEDLQVDTSMLNPIAPVGEPVPITTPDFSAHQGYLGPAPVGIDAHFAWTQAGGRGWDVRVIAPEWRRRGVANALLRHFSEKLPVSRWQRDLTDSTVLRNLGVALGHALIAWRALLRGLGKIAANPARLAEDVSQAWEVLAEPIQTALRAAGVPGGYELLKDFTRGHAIDSTALAVFIETLPISEDERARLKRLRPEDYVGIAARLARDISAK